MRHEHEHEKELAVEVGGRNEAKRVARNIEDQDDTAAGDFDLVGAAPSFADIAETTPRRRECRLEPSIERSFRTGMEFCVFTDAEIGRAHV